MPRKKKSAPQESAERVLQRTKEYIEETRAELHAENDGFYGNIQEAFSHRPEEDSDPQRKKGKGVLAALYDAAVVSLLFASFLLNLLGLIGVIEIEEGGFFYADLSLTVFFWTEYLLRFFLARNKRKFFERNIFELISILPFSPVFGVMHIVRFLHILGVFEKIAFTALWQKIKHSRLSRFLSRTSRKISLLLHAHKFLIGLYGFLLLFLTLAYVLKFIEDAPYFSSVLSLLSGTATLCLAHAPVSLFGQIVSGALFSLLIALLVWLIFACVSTRRRVLRYRRAFCGIKSQKKGKHSLRRVDKQTRKW